MKESIEEFLARGGEIVKLKRGPKTTTTNSEFMKRDRVLVNLKRLLKQDGLTDEDRFMVECAIRRRIELLR